MIMNADYNASKKPNNEEAEIPKRILHIIHSMNMGGAETMLMNIYRNIDREQFQFDFMVHTNKESVYDKEILALGGRIYRVPGFRGINFKKYTDEWYTFFEQHDEYRIVHGHIGISAVLYLYLARKYGRYVIAHIHSAKPGRFSLRQYIRSLYFYPIRYEADYFFACSKKAGMDRLGNRIVHSQKFSVFNNGIAAEQFIFNKNVRKKIRAELGISADAFVVGHVGRMDKQKNHLFLIDIFSEIKKREKRAQLLLVGDGSLRGQIEKKVQNYGLADSVIMTGVREDASALFSAMDVFVFPSLSEGLGIAAVEAQAAGLHAICSNVLPEEIKLTELIEFLPPVDAGRWAKHVIKYAAGYLRRDMSAEMIRSHYDIGQTSQSLQQFYLRHWK